MPTNEARGRRGDGSPHPGGVLMVTGRGVSRTRYGVLAIILVVVGGIWWLATDDRADQLGGDTGLVAEAAEVAAREEAEEGARAADAAEQTERQVDTTWTVYHVVDGDTVDVRHSDGTEERVRVIGIDTPERGECGFGPATTAMADLLDGQEVALVGGARDDRDRYGRIIRYVDVDGVDAGLSLIEDGLAISRYDSRDGYGGHDREAAYVAADAGLTGGCDAPTPAPATSAPSSDVPSDGFATCASARDAGAAPVRRGDPGYHPRLDGDGDGVGCE